PRRGGRSSAGGRPAASVSGRRRSADADGYRTRRPGRRRASVAGARLLGGDRAVVCGRLVAGRLGATRGFVGRGLVGRGLVARGCIARQVADVEVVEVDALEVAL